MLSGIIFINRKWLALVRRAQSRKKEGGREYGEKRGGKGGGGSMAPHKTLYNRWKRWSERGVFARILAGLAAEEP